MPKHKQVYLKKNPPSGKHPRGGEKVSESENKKIVWRVVILDKEGDWGWGTLESSMLWEEIYSKMVNFETMTFPDAERHGSHPVAVGDLCRDAQKRLEDINQSDIDELFSLRLTGKKRIWGIRDRNIFKILWWDPLHQVCPSKKKHT